jgi:hypothetical protein
MRCVTTAAACAAVTVLLLCATIASAQSSTTCPVADSACTGRSVKLGNGSCAMTSSVCNDGVACTTDACALGVCTITASGSTCATCLQVCEPDCADKECGNDPNCGTFCGTCADGLSCDANYRCTTSSLPGTCGNPLALGTINASQILTITGNTDDALVTHTLTPLCNFRSASPELIYRFTVPAGKTMGFEIRTTGYDTVLALMKDHCYTNATIACNDDATPPGNLGSSISGLASAGTYYLMVDGFDSAAKGNFTATMKFVEGCQPKCDGAFCGSDSCGGTCGSCDTGFTCRTSDARCYETDCVPSCGTANNRSCGEDGCGGSCGDCGANSGCVHASITWEDGEEVFNNASVPPSYCQFIPTCDHFAPNCTGCNSTQYCGSDCTCYDVSEALPDFIVHPGDARDDMYLHQVDVTNTSCQLVEKCVGGTGVRNLLRFTASSTNQGQAAFVPPPPKNNPQMFEWGTCHQHYHFKSFMEYRLLNTAGVPVNQKGYKAAFCMEDTRRELDGADVPCLKQHDCGTQGISRGWADSYGWSLDCSWIDVTGIAAGSYVLRVTVNPERRIAEASYTNNEVCVRVNIPAASVFTAVPTKLNGNSIVDCSAVGSSAASLSFTTVVVLAIVTLLMW